MGGACRRLWARRSELHHRSNMQVRRSRNPLALGVSPADDGDGGLCLWCEGMPRDT